MPKGINDKADVVGTYSITSVSRLHPRLSAINGRDLSFPYIDPNDDGLTVATGIDDSGEIVGYSSTRRTSTTVSC